MKTTLLLTLFAVGIALFLASCTSRARGEASAQASAVVSDPSQDDATSATPSRAPSLDLAGQPLDFVTLSEEAWRERLTPEQFDILRQQGTERAFTSPLNKIKDPGLFRCAGCEAPLFDVKTKFDSGTGWPSFYEPIIAQNVHEVEDNTYGMRRVEIECNRCGGHLGHVFPDGPKPTGLRYCMNGVSLAFEKAN